MIPAAPADGSRQFSVAADVFLRALAIVWFVAFASLWGQLPGLIGPNGILPAQSHLDAVAARLGADRWWQVPTLCWVFGTGWFLHVLCAAGLLLSVAAFLRLCPPVSFGLLWLCYLSLCAPAQVFLNFQWDALLLETGLLAVVLAPWSRSAGARPEPPRLARWLLWFLLFRLMFMSGLVKLTSGDDSWRDLTALTYHYETQPLPTWVGWWIHQLPEWFHRLSCAVMFAVELVGPFLLFGPRRLRHAAALVGIVFQAIIALTGNYTFFNLLTAALYILFFDDAWWSRWFGVRPQPCAETTRAAANAPRRAAILRWTRRGVAAGLFAASLIVTLPSVARPRQWPGWYVTAFHLASATRSVNSYGLFRVMTRTRPEIVFEGSDDGRVWKPYAFRWKPGDLARRPGFVAPHQPRLDCQLWFGALAHARREPWVLQLGEHLLRGTPAVLALLAENPFPNRPPRHLRAVLHEYSFTTTAERRRTRHWWKRDPLDYYFTPTSLR